MATDFGFTPGTFLGNGLGRTGVIVADADYRRILALLHDEPGFGFGDDALDAAVSVLTVHQTKGLEFDQVIVVDPRALSAQAPFGADAYVACTRATRTLHLVDLVAANPAHSDFASAPSGVAQSLPAGSERR